MRFIQRSCSAFDNGTEEESIRIATSLRIIFHCKNRNVSLISHLKFEGRKILSSSRGFGDWKDYLSQKIELSSREPIRMAPLLGNMFKECSIEDWWNNETVFIYEGHKYSRRMIVLSVADKDGGAHVDAELERYYEVLCAGEYALGITGNLQYDGEVPFPQGVTIYPKNAHLALIRQFAHETLISFSYFNWLNSDS